MNAAVPLWNATCPGPSCETLSDGSAPAEVASWRMVDAAMAAGLPRTTWLSGERMWPPAELTSELNHTVRPSYWAPCSSMKCGLPSAARWLASAIICAQVVGGLDTRSLRYHSSSVFELMGTAQSWFFHVAV